MEAAVGFSRRTKPGQSTGCSGILSYTTQRCSRCVETTKGGVRRMRTKTLWIKDDYLRQILSGRKTVEVRVGYSNITRLEVGDRLLLNDEHPFCIVRIGRYASFDELLTHEDPANIAPDLSPDELLEVLRGIYPPEKEALGVVALEIEGG